MSTVRRGPDAVITIGTSTTVSNAIDLGEGALVGLQLPAALTGVAITIQASDAIDGTFSLVALRGGAFSITVAANTYIALLSEETRGYRFIKLVSGSAEAADRTIKTYVRNIS